MKEVCNRAYFAAIDIGSNAIRMALAHHQGTELRLTHSWREFLRLGEDVFESGNLSQANLTALIEILEKFINILKDYPNVEISIVATSAMRDAKNQQSVIKHVRERLGLRVKIISGAEEAGYILKIIQDQLTWGKERVILADLGGGSLEISVMQSTQILFQKSFDGGVLRFSKLDLPSQQQFLNELERQLTAEVTEYFVPPIHLILTGGTSKMWARLIHSQQFSEKPLEKPFVSSWEVFLQMSTVILKKSPREYVSFKQIRSDQAELLIPSLLIFERLGKISQCKKVTIPFVGLKEGVLLQSVRQKVPQCRLLLLP